jgi:hypothetical protein
MAECNPLDPAATSSAFSVFSPAIPFCPSVMRPIMDLGTNVPRDYFVAVLLASEVCPISNAELLKDGLWSAETSEHFFT